MSITAIKSQKQILKSTSILGSSRALSIGVSLISVKVIALLLGPVGIGLIGLYQSVVGTASVVVGMGLGNSGVRQIAEARSLDDEAKIAGARFALRWLTIFLATIGAAILILFSREFSIQMFGTPDHSVDVAILSVAVFFVAINSSQAAVLQGFRRVGDIALCTILGAICGTIISLALVIIFREEGIALMVTALAVVNCLFSWWYVRRVPKSEAILTFAEIWAQSVFMLKLGSVFMARGFVTAAVLLAIRFLITEDMGLAAVGFFSASWMLSRRYSDLVLEAMGKDFYPRLTAIHTDSIAVVRLVNEQLEMALLLAGPLLLAMLTFAPFVIYTLYSAEFVSETSAILRWQIVGTLFRIITFPLGYICLAKGLIKTAFFVNLVWNAMFFLLVLVGLGWIGLEVTGIAFCLAYMLHVFINLVVARRLVDFRMNDKNKFHVAILSLAVLVIMVVSQYDELLAYIIGGVITFAYSLLSGKQLYRLAGVTPWGYVLNRIRKKRQTNI